MSGRVFQTLTMLAGMVASLGAQTQRRATIVGGGLEGSGKCTVEVVVDGAVEVELRGNTATLRNMSGQPAEWRRFECTGRMPANVADVQFRPINGRGRQELISDPRNNGIAVVRIEDPSGGAEEYTFEIVWSGGDTGNYDSQRRNRGNRDYGQVSNEAVRACQRAVRQRASERFGSDDIEFRETNMDDAGGVNRVVGTLLVRRGDLGAGEAHRFSCSLDSETGRVGTARIDDTGNRGYQDNGQRSRTNDGGGALNPRALRNCKRAVEERLQADGYGAVEFQTIRVDNRSGSGGLIGTARADGDQGSQLFNFSCSMEMDGRTLQSVDVRRR